jgi:hypothetical protein
VDTLAEATRLFDSIVESPADDIEIEVEEDNPMSKEEVYVEGSAYGIDDFDFSLLPTK